MKAQKNHDSIIPELDNIKGKSVWTAELTRLYSREQRLDELPTNYSGIKRVISSYYCGDIPIEANEACRSTRHRGDRKV
jgi:hypothetical protein